MKKKLSDLERELREATEEFRKTRAGAHCYPLLLTSASIRPELVDQVYEELMEHHADCDGRLDVLVDSGGGDIDAAYNLGQLLRRFGHEELNFIVPRWAKSAATLVVCSGNRILMTPVAELGPMDPQITQMNPLERRLETFSPLHIDSTLDLIREEFAKGSRELAAALMNRLQFPMTLGAFRKSLDIAKQYLTKLLSSRMLADQSPEKIKRVAERLTSGYSDHGFCINLEEAKDIGLVAEDIPSDSLKIVWKIHRINRKRNALLRERAEKETREKLKDLPPGLLDQLPPDLQRAIGNEGKNP